MNKRVAKRPARTTVAKASGRVQQPKRRSTPAKETRSASTHRIDRSRARGAGRAESPRRDGDAGANEVESSTRTRDAETGKIIARLRSVEGHLRGIAQMVESGASCADVLRQTKAVRAALTRVDGALLEKHLDRSVSGIRSGDSSGRERVINDLVELFVATR